MKRYTMFVLIIIGSAASAIAAIAPGHRAVVQPATHKLATHNVTVIEKNQAWPLVGPLIVEECSTEDCSGSRI